MSQLIQVAGAFDFRSSERRRIGLNLEGYATGADEARPDVAHVLGTEGTQWQATGCWLPAAGCPLRSFFRLHRRISTENGAKKGFSRFLRCARHHGPGLACGWATWPGCPLRWQQLLRVRSSLTARSILERATEYSTVRT